MSTVTEANPFVTGGRNPDSDAIWILISAFIIFTMQSGFGLLESGLVSSKNEANVMIKNMLDVTLGGISFWFFGFGFGFGDDDDHGTQKMSGLGYFGWDLINVDTEGQIYAKYFFQLSFATTATTIVSGAVAERVRLKSYIIFAILNTGLIYAFPAHWMWHPKGWLADLGAFDFAGSSVVHMSGGAAALAASIILGPRHKRFGRDRKPYYMASPTNVVLGTFFLWWGWIGFNCGSTFGMSGSLWKIASRTAVVTMNGAMGGGLSAVILSLVLDFSYRHYLLDIPQFVSGILGGLVAITAPAAAIEPWEALVIGFIGGWVANGAIALLDKLHIDDPVGCVGVHWAAGVWAMIATALFVDVDPVAGLAPEEGAFRGGNWHLLGANLAACCAITVWSGGLTAIVFLVMKYTIGIRMDLEEELKGSDEVEHDIVNKSAPGEPRFSMRRQLSTVPEDAESIDGVQLRKVNKANGADNNGFDVRLDK